MHRILTPFAVLAFVLVLFALPASAAQTQGGRASFIVVLKPSVARAAPVAAEHANRFGGEVRYIYENALKGYAATFSEGQLGALAADRRVASIERDGVMTAFTTQTNPPSWGLDRIDQRNAARLTSTYTYTSTGAGVNAYIIDTGIRTRTSSSAGARERRLRTPSATARTATTATGTAPTSRARSAERPTASRRRVTLVAVRVLDCSGSGTWSGVIAGIDWVTGRPPGR